MITVRKCTHIFILIGEIVLAFMTLAIFIVGLKLNYSSKRIIWICSKIKTVNQILYDNLYNTYPIKEINSTNDTDIESAITRFDSIYNYDYLLNHSTREKCEIDFKRCGKLDTYDNIMCIPNNESCPINNIIIESKSEEDVYNDEIFNEKIYTQIDLPSLLPENYSLFYSKNGTGNNITVKLNFTEDSLYYIYNENIIFDKDTFDKYYDNSDDNQSYGNEKVTEYINGKLSDDKNIDNDYSNITYYCRHKKYIGFEKTSDIYNIINYNDNPCRLIKIRFPNIVAISFAMISFFVLLILIIFSLVKLFSTEQPGKPNYSTNVLQMIIISVIFISIFLGYLIYFIHEYYFLKDNNKCGKLIKIKSDDFIEDYLDEICKPTLRKKYLIITGFVLFPFSLLCLLIGLFYEKLYVLFLYITRDKMKLKSRYLRKRYNL